MPSAAINISGRDPDLLGGTSGIKIFRDFARSVMGPIMSSFDASASKHMFRRLQDYSGNWKERFRLINTYRRG